MSINIGRGKDHQLSEAILCSIPFLQLREQFSKFIIVNCILPRLSYPITPNEAMEKRIAAEKRSCSNGNTVITGAVDRIRLIRGTNYINGDYIIPRRCIDLAAMPIERSTLASYRSSVYLLKGV